MTNFVFPFDPTGSQLTNRIINEQHVITVQNFRDYHYVIPKFAPFFEDNFSVKRKLLDGTVQQLVPGIDYYFANQFLDASRACAKPVYGSVSFLDTDAAGIITINYYTVGGMWNITVEEIARILAEETRNPRITAWEQVTYLPERFPVVDHEWDLTDMVGEKEVVSAIETVREAILNSAPGGGEGHMSDFNNPHATTKTQVGLGNVEDFPIATSALAQEGLSNAHYMTPLRTSDAIAAMVSGLMATHLLDFNNPHQVTKAQVGLGSVQNYAVALEIEATAGVVNNRYMTPLRTAQAIAAAMDTSITGHIANTLNPHNVTKAQVGLSQVANYPVASQQDALGGIVTDKYMTPQRTMQLVQSVMQQMAGAQINEHLQDGNNPHHVVKAQIGLEYVENYPIANLDQAREGIASDVYMTPALVTVTIVEKATPIAHLADTDNPHEVSAGQLGVYTTDEVDFKLATVDNKFSNYIEKDDQWVAGMPADDFITLTRNGTVTNALQLNGMGITDIVEQSVATLAIKSIDVATVEDAEENPHRWIMLGLVTGEFVPMDVESTAIDITHPDAYWFMSGGHKQEESEALNAAASSPAYIIHAKNGLMDVLHTVDVMQLNGEVDNDIQFGYTFSVETDALYVWLKTTAGYNDISISRLTSHGNRILLLDDDVFEEPEGIVYVTPTRYANAQDVSELTSRVQAIEDTLNSIVVV